MEFPGGFVPQGVALGYTTLPFQGKQPTTENLCPRALFGSFGAFNEFFLFLPINLALNPAKRTTRSRWCSGSFWAARRVSTSKQLICNSCPPAPKNDSISVHRISGVASIYI